MLTSGPLRRMPLTVLVRERCQAGETARIILNEDGRVGEVCILRGQVLHAQYGDLTGPAAFYDMSGWQKGTFSVEPELSLEAQTIDMPWAQLLIECAKRAFTAGFDDAALDPQLEAEENPDSQEEAEELPDQDMELESFAQISGVTEAFEVAPDGTILRAEPAHELEESQGAAAALIGGAGEQLAEILALGSFEQGTVTIGSRRFVVFKHDDRYWGLALGNQASAALVSSTVRRILSS